MRRPRGLFKARGGRHRVGFFVPSSRTWHRDLDAAQRKARGGEVWRVYNASVRDLKEGGSEGWYIEALVPPEPGAVSGL